MVSGDSQVVNAEIQVRQVRFEPKCSGEDSERSVDSGYILKGESVRFVDGWVLAT